MADLRARMKVVSIVPMQAAEGEIKLDARFSTESTSHDENNGWAKYQAVGDIRLIITNPDAASALVVGEHYLIDFTHESIPRN